MAAAIISTKQLGDQQAQAPSQPPSKQLLSSNNYAQLVAQNTNGQRANKLATIDDRAINGNANSEPLRYKIGDLVWAKVNNHPWWPCRVSRDLNDTYFRYEDKISMYHVDFIGPVRENGWALEINMFKYDGIESFKTYAQDQVDRASTKAEKEKLAERFQLKVSLNRRENWQKAVDSADTLIRSIKNSAVASHKRKRDQSCDDRTSSSMDSIDGVNKKFEKKMYNGNKHGHKNDMSSSATYDYPNEDDEEDDDDDQDDEEENNEPSSQPYVVGSNHNRVKSKSMSLPASSSSKKPIRKQIHSNKPPSTFNNHMVNDSILDHDNPLKLKIKLNSSTNTPNAPPLNRSRSNSSTSSTQSSVSHSTSSTNSAAMFSGKKAAPQNASKGRQRKSKSFSISDGFINEANMPMFASAGIGAGGGGTTETYLIDRYKYAVMHIQQGLSVEEACNKYRISKGALLKCLSGGTAPRGKKTRLTETEENEIVQWLISYKDLKYNDAIHLVFEQVVRTFEQTQRPNPFNNGKPSMDWWYDFLSRHPQIMASKPDWLMRGKVNDKYIQDVQSGHLKCTKFRRALLSAIQYINSMNENGTGSASSAATNGQNSNGSFSTQSSQENYQMSKPEKKSSKRNSNKYAATATSMSDELAVDENGGAARLSLIHGGNGHSSASTSFSSQMANSLVLNNSGSDDFDTPIKSEYFISTEAGNVVGHQSVFLNHHESEDQEDEGDEEDDEDADDEDQTDATFDNELFSSALDDHQFESLIDPSTTVVTGTGSAMMSSNHNIHVNGGTASSSNAYFSSGHHEYMNSVSDLKPMMYSNQNGSQVYRSSPSSSSSYGQHHQHTHHPPLLHHQTSNDTMAGAQHLLVPDDDDDQAAGLNGTSADHHHHQHQHNPYHHHAHHHHHNHHLNHQHLHHDHVEEDEAMSGHTGGLIKNENAGARENAGGGRSLINDDEDDDELMVNTIDPSAFLP